MVLERLFAQSIVEAVSRIGLYILYIRLAYVHGHQGKKVFASTAPFGNLKEEDAR